MFTRAITDLVRITRLPGMACAVALMLTVHAGAATAPTVVGHYGPNYRHTVDLYVPQGRPGPFPVVAYIHGGGWLAGDSTLVQPYVDDLMARGIAVAAVNYRYSMQATFPAQLYDCKAAIRWLRAHADEYSLDTTRFAVFGESAGAHLASLVGTTSGDPAFEGDVGDDLGQPTDVLCVVHGYGPTDLVALSLYNFQRGLEVSQLIGHDIYDIIDHETDPTYAAWVALVTNANPCTHVNAGDPPTYLAHGEIDTGVPSSQSLALADALDAAGVPNILRIMPGTGHTLPTSELPAIYAFLSQHLLVAPFVFAAGGAGDGDAFGSAITVIGDVNTDGVLDFAVGAPLNDDRGVDAGRVTIHSGVDGSVLRIIRGGAKGDRFGASLAAIGDITGDGISDFAVGAPRSNAAGKLSGKVDLFNGATGARIKTFAGEHAGDQMGTSVGAIDLDGDGVREIVGGASLADGPATDCGHVLIWNSATGALVKRIKGTGTGDHFGSAVANAGDVDGDGRDDLVIGAPYADAGGNNGGSVAVWGKAGNQWKRRYQRHGASGEQLGWDVVGLGDADGDGRSDIAAGAPGSRASNTQRSGRVHVLAPATHTVVAVLEPAEPANGQQFGSALAAPGDVDGDDLADVVVGASRDGSVGVDGGSVATFTGSGAPVTALAGQTIGGRFGKAFAVADLDGDGVQELFIGAPGDVWGGIQTGALYTVIPGSSQ